MSWTVWADPFESGELANTNKFCTIKFNSNTILRAIRTWIVLYNNPTFTDLTMKIYSNEVVSGSNTPKKLLYSSTTTHLKSEITTYDNAVREVYFEFNYIPINGDDSYNLVINGSGYVFSDASHLAWKKAWPDPVYTTGYTPTMGNLVRAPYAVYAIGGDF